MVERKFCATFEVVDDFIWAASTRGFAGVDSICIVSAERLGPVIELAMARCSRPEFFSNVSFVGADQELVHAALDEGSISGGDRGDNVGILPMTRDESTRPGGDRYEQWLLRFQTAAAQAGFRKPFARQLAGALSELVDNVLEHSESVFPSLAGFKVAQNSVEFVVADGGIGILKSLRKNPAHLNLKDTGQALEAIVHNGASRFPVDSGHGQGIKQFLRTLVGQNGHLRFRSCDHALTLRGSLAIDAGTLEVSSKAELPGLTVSAQCLLSPTAEPGARS